MTAALKPTARPVGVFKAINMVPTFSGGEPSAVTLAGGCDVISATPHQLAPYLDAMRAANPALVVLAYNNATFSFDTRLPENLYLHSASGGRVHSNNYPGNWCMDPASDQWVAALIAKVLADLGAHDGVMLDMLGPYPTAPGYLSAPAVNPRTNEIYTAAQWCIDTGTLAAQVKQALLRNAAGQVVVGNGLVDGQAMLATPSTTRILLGIDGGLAEGWMPLKVESSTQFGDALDALTEAAGTEGKYLFPMVKPWHAPSAADADTAHRFSLASYLLTATPFTFYSYAGTNTEQGVTALSPYESVPVGSAVGAAQTFPDGHLSRRFTVDGNPASATSGWAIVNPTGVEVTVNLGQPQHEFVDLDGRTSPGTFTVGPWSSTILHAA